MEQNWAIVIPAKYVLSKDISSTQKLLIGIISGLSNVHGYCYASNDYLSNCLDINKLTASILLNDLAKKKYIDITFKYKAGSKEIECRIIKLILDLSDKSNIPILEKRIDVSFINDIPILENTKDNIYNNKIHNKINKHPTLDEVISYFIEKGSTEEQAKNAFEYYAVADWKDSRGKQVKNWKQKMLAVWINNSINKNKKTDYEQRVNHAASIIGWAEQQDRANGVK